MSYLKLLEQLAKQVIETTELIQSLEKTRADWLKPREVRLRIGPVVYGVVREDLSTNPLLAGVQREMLKTHDDELFKARSRLEGLHFQIRKLRPEDAA